MAKHKGNTECHMRGRKEKGQVWPEGHERSSIADKHLSSRFQPEYGFFELRVGEAPDLCRDEMLSQCRGNRSERTVGHNCDTLNLFVMHSYEFQMGRQSGKALPSRELLGVEEHPMKGRVLSLPADRLQLDSWTLHSIRLEPEVSTPRE
jgi:hypothetical protein